MKVYVYTEMKSYFSGEDAPELEIKVFSDRYVAAIQRPEYRKWLI